MTKTTVTPAAMSILTLAVTWAGLQAFFQAATTVTGFLTSLVGLVAAVFAAVYWKRKVMRK